MSKPSRPAFSAEMKTKLTQAVAICQVINTAAYSADGADGIGGAAWAVTSMLTEVEDYIEMNFSSISDSKDANHE